MRRLCQLLCGLVFFLGMSAPAIAPGQKTPDKDQRPSARAESFEVHTVGNKRLSDEELEAVLDLPWALRPTAEHVEIAEDKLEKFLEEQGFELARVDALAFRGELWVFVDEGRIDEVFVTGAGTVKTARMQLDFDLPDNIYHRSYVDDTLAGLRKKYGLRSAEAEVFGGVAREPENLQRRLVAALQTGDVTEAVKLYYEAGGEYSLRILTRPEEEWGSGLTFGLDLLGPFGLEASVGYEDTALFFEGDRYSTELVLGGAIDRLFTLAEAELFYATPEQFDESVRPAIDIDASLENLERESLALDEYLYLQTDAVVQVGFEPRTNLVISPGVGYGYDSIISVDRSEQTPRYATETERSFPIGQIGLEWLIGRVGFRRDKLHLLEAIVEVRSVDEGWWSRIEGDYQKAWALGEDDLFLRSNFFSFLGDGVEWFDEDPIASQVLRAVPGEHEFARDLLALGTEYRLALYEQTFKAGLSAAGAAASLQNRQTSDQYLEFFASGGPGVHIQLFGNFQLNLYYHYGWRADGETGGQFSLKLWKVY